MVDSIGGRTGPLAREARLAAMKSQARAAAEVRTEAAQVDAGAAGSPADMAAPATNAPDFAQALRDGVAEVNASVQDAEALPEELARGDVGSVAEVATRLKTAELSFRFSMEIRNKLIDAYREVMRMQV